MSCLLLRETTSLSCLKFRAIVFFFNYRENGHMVAVAPFPLVLAPSSAHIIESRAPCACACTHTQTHITLHLTPASVLFEETPIALWSAVIDPSMLLLLLVVQKHGVYLRAAAAATLFAWPPCPM